MSERMKESRLEWWREQERSGKLGMNFETLIRDFETERKEVERLREENTLCREAIEAAENMYISLSHELDSDSAQGCIRATRRRMQEAIGRAAPKLMLEHPEGQKFYGLLWRELRAEKEAAETRLTRLVEHMKHIARHYGSAEQCRELAQAAIAEAQEDGDE